MGSEQSEGMRVWVRELDLRRAVDALEAESREFADCGDKADEHLVDGYLESAERFRELLGEFERKPAGLRCTRCGWTGDSNTVGRVDLGEGVQDLVCPECGYREKLEVLETGVCKGV